MTTVVDPNQLIAYQGKTFRALFTVMDGAATPSPISLAGHGATFAILSRPGGTVIFSFTDQTTIDPVTNATYSTTDLPVLVEPNGSTGQVYVRIGADVMSQLKRDAVYDCSVYLLTDSTEIAALAAGPLHLILEGGDA